MILVSNTRQNWFQSGVLLLYTGGFSAGHVELRQVKVDDVISIIRLLYGKVFLIGRLFVEIR